MTTPAPCERCGGSQCLSQKGIAAVYLKPHLWAVGIMVLGLVLALWRGSKGWLLLSLLGYLLPLAMADLRLLLYPWVAVNALCGRRVNCPSCNPGASIFKH